MVIKEQTDEWLENILNLNKGRIPDLVKLGILIDSEDNARLRHEGNSNYSFHIIQPWSIWLDYPELTTWDHDIIKRVLRTKNEQNLTGIESRMLDYRKIIHICQERLRQLKYEQDNTV